MSFFVSKDLEGKIDESCLVPHEETPLSQEFVFKFDNNICDLIEIDLNDVVKVINFSFESNIHVLDNLFSNNIDKAKIIFKNTYLDLTQVKIEKIFKRESDIYILEVSANYHRGNT